MVETPRLRTETSVIGCGKVKVITERIPSIAEEGEDSGKRAKGVCNVALR